MLHYLVFANCVCRLIVTLYKFAHFLLWTRSLTDASIRWFRLIATIMQTVAIVVTIYLLSIKY